MYQSADLVKILDDAHAELFHFGRWRQQVRHHDGHHAGTGRGADAVVGIFQRHAQLGRDTKTLSGFQERLGIWLAARIIAIRDDRLEPIDEAQGSKVALYVFMPRRRGDCPRQSGAIEHIEQFDDACLHAQLRPGQFLKLI